MWKELFDREDFYENIANSKTHNDRVEILNGVKDFISKEVVEKIIADIPDEQFDKYSSRGYVELHRLKQKLKDKYL